MARQYVPLDVAFFEDDRIVELDPPAQLVYLRALTLAKRVGTDGRVTAGQLRRLCGDLEGLDGYVAALVACGLWTQQEATYVISGWLTWNKSVAELEQYREDQRESGRRGGRASGQTRRAKGGAKGEPSSSGRDGLQGAEGSGEATPPDQTRSEEDPTPPDPCARRESVVDAYVAHKAGQGGLNSPEALRRAVHRDNGRWLDQWLADHPSARDEQAGDALDAHREAGRGTRGAA